MKELYMYVWPRDQIKAMKDSHEKAVLGYIQSWEGPPEHRSQQCVRPSAPLLSIAVLLSVPPPLITVQPSAPPLSVTEGKSGHFFPIAPCLEIQVRRIVLW